MRRETKHGSLPRAARALAATLTATAALGCESLLGIDDTPDATPGYLFYSTNTSGVTEIWAIADTGGLPARLTDGATRDSVSYLHGPEPSLDGLHVAFASRLDAAGVDADTRHVWIMASDGAGLRHLVQASPNNAFFGMSWEADGRHLVYANEVACSNNILRIDTEVGGEPQVLYDVEDIAANPRVRPTDANDVLFWDQRCGEVGSLRRLDARERTVTRVPDTVDDQSRYRYGQWSADGTRYVYAEEASIYVHDLASEQLVYRADDSDGTFASPSFGNDDLRLYARWCGSDDACDLVVIDPDRDTMTALEVPDIYPHTGNAVMWAPRAVDIDRDRDGLGNGIDPD